MSVLYCQGCKNNAEVSTCHLFKTYTSIITFLHIQKYKRNYELPELTMCKFFTNGSTKIMANCQCNSSSESELQNCILTTSFPHYQCEKWNCRRLGSQFFITINTKETGISARQFVFCIAVNNTRNIKTAYMRTLKPQLLMTYV